MLANFKEVRARFADRLGKDLTLLVVTFDPQSDTVEMLNAYARAHNADAPGWHFLTGPLSEITRMCEAFGIEFWPEEGLLSHTLQTAVLDRDGRLAGTIEGTAYSGRQLGDLIASIIDPRVSGSPCHLISGFPHLSQAAAPPRPDTSSAARSDSCRPRTA